MNDRSGRPGRLGVALLAALAYVPSLASSAGVMPADTKLYLYLDPGRLIGDAPYTFDGRQFAGWVPHQVIAYLWPQGPWYWLGDQLGLPDWIVHRLWLGTLMFLAGCGVLWCARRLGLGVGAAVAAALVYQVSPYVLPYVSRTSAMLLPWAGLGWIVGLTVLAARRGGWRHPATLALVVASVGAVNATALLMVVPAPALWLVVATVTGEVTWRRALATAGRIAVLCLAVSAWWIGAVVLQGRHGADVLSFSETLRAVSRTSTAPEVWRAMGYWLAYIQDHVSATTTAALAYVSDRPTMLASFVVPILGVLGLTFTRFAARRYAVALVVTGLVLAVGVHPIDDPTPLMDLAVGDTESGAALALRSSTRAIPVLLLGLGFGVGALIDAVAARTGVATGRRRPAPRAGPLATYAGVGAVALVVLAAMPALRQRQLIDPSLSRTEDVPEAWREAADALDALPDGYRVMQVPGLEFGAFRWGYTVDPPLPGLTDRPVVTRDLLPLGSGPAMDLLWALDNRFQDGVAEPAAIAPVARLFGVDRIWLTGDAAYERFRTPRPELISAFFADAEHGLSDPIPYGEAVANIAAVPTVDETALTDGRVGEPVAPVELVSVEDAVPVVRAKDEVVLVGGSGDGIVDAAAAGLLTGHELLRYTGSLTALDDAVRVAALDGATRIIVTDSNRDRAAGWAGSQDTTGFTESSAIPGRDLLDPVGDDVRLDVFDPDATPAHTDAVQDGPVVARATGYGDPFSFRPEDRPVMAIDGDPATAWRVADRADARGARLELTTGEGIDQVTLRQPDGAAKRRHIREVRVTVAAADGGAVRFDEVVTLDDRSFDGDGQRIEIPATSGPSRVVLEIVGLAAPDSRPGPAMAAVGFAEVDLGLGPTVEVVRVGVDLTPAEVAAAGLDATYVFTRLRTDPLDRWRSDPEPELVREWTQLVAEPVAPVTVTVRIDRRADDATVASALGITGARSTGYAAGAVSAAGWAATDGDPSTAWMTPFGDPRGHELAFTLAAPTSTLRLTQPDGALSTIEQVRVRAGAVDVTGPVVTGPDNVSTVDLGVELPAGPVRLTIAAVSGQETLDRRHGEPVILPAAISEIADASPTTIPEQVTGPCRDDLLAVDGVPIPLAVEGDASALLAGEPVEARVCGALPELTVGTHRLSTTARGTGWTVDRVVIGDTAVRAAPESEGPDESEGLTEADGPTATVTTQHRLGRTVTVSGCTDGCWLVLGEGHHPQWSARTATGSLGPPVLVDGGFNGWWIEPTTGDVVVTVSWGAQRPMNVALGVTVVGLLACVALIAVGVRREPPAALVRVPVGTGARWAFPGAVLTRRGRLVTIGVWAVAAAVLVGPVFGALAVVAGAVLVGIDGRPRLVGLLTVGILVTVALAYNWAFVHQPPVPPYDVPVRFERLHRIALFAAVSLVALLMTADDEGATP